MAVGNEWSHTKFGARAGVTLGCAYAMFLGLVWVFTSISEIDGIAEFIVSLLWFWFYGCIFGSVIGFVLGSLTGYILSRLLSFFVPRVTRQAWLIGIATCACFWIIFHLTLGEVIISNLESDPYLEGSLLLYRVLILYPGIIYTISGAGLAQWLYVQSEGK